MTPAAAGLFAVTCIAWITGCSRAPLPETDVVPKHDIELEQHTPLVTELAVMPTHFSAQVVGNTETLPASEWRLYIEAALQTAVENAIDESPIAIKPTGLDVPTIAADPELRSRVFENLTAMRRARKAIREAERTIDVDFDADVDYFCDLAGCDYLVYVEGSGWYKSEAARATNESSFASILIGVLFPGATESIYAGTELAAYIVDGTRGKVLWYNRVQVFNADPRRPSSLLLCARQLFNPLWHGGSREERPAQESPLVVRSQQ
jgi:hypothetical protein